MESGIKRLKMRDSILLELLRTEALNKYFNIRYSKIRDGIKVKKNYKISICTNCMNRLEDVKRTLPKNIEDNTDYPNIEFVLLNYNSEDELDRWVFHNMKEYIDKGILNYYKTREPKYYSMTHSRNIEFKIAQGDIVNNVDADHFTNKGFAKMINLLANQHHKKTVFVKSKQKNRGRLGFFKKEFLWLGGYNEEIEGYGFDDEDLLLRAYHSGFTILKFGGGFMNITDDHRRHVMTNYKNKDWKFTQRKNTLISMLSLAHKKYRANRGHEWGVAKLIKNFKEEIDTRNL
jgi:hypothetical protein